MMVKILIDEILPVNDSCWSLESFILVMVVRFVFGIIVVFIRDYITVRLGNQMGLDIRHLLYSHLQKLSPQYYDNRQIGTIVSRVQNVVNGDQNLVRGGVINLVIDMFMVIFAGIMLFSLNWKLALLSFWILPLYYLTFANLNVRIRFAWRSVHWQIARISGVLFERI